MRFALQIEFETRSTEEASGIKNAVLKVLAEARSVGALTKKAELKGPYQMEKPNGQAMPVRVYSDGGCIKNPGGAGGWGYRLEFPDGTVKEVCGGEASSTNNRMELLAAIMALEAISPGIPVLLHTDSQYVKRGITEWVPWWIHNGWRTADRRPVKNQDLWERLHAASKAHSVTFKWVRGHAGHAGNERADALAREGMRPYL